MGDSKEQNGSFNISMTKAKVDLLELKESKCMNGNNSVTDIVPLINRSWNTSFARVGKIEMLFVKEDGFHSIEISSRCQKFARQ